MRWSVWVILSWCGALLAVMLTAGLAGCGGTALAPATSVIDTTTPPAGDTNPPADVTSPPDTTPPPTDTPTPPDTTTPPADTTTPPADNGAVTIKIKWPPYKPR